MEVYSVNVLETMISKNNSVAIVGGGMVGKKLYHELSEDSRKKVIAFIDNWMPCMAIA